MAMAGDRFAYHGTGGELFKGFLKALLVFFLPVAALNATAQLSGNAVVVALANVVSYLAFLTIVPVAVVGARRYRLSRTSWRGIRFGFVGRARDYFNLWVLSSFLTPLTLGLYYPIFHSRSHAFLTSHSTFGQQQFGFDGQPRETFRPFLIAVLLALPTLGLYLAWYIAWRRRYYWSHTTFGAARFRCVVTGRQLLNLVVGNVLLLLVTLGFAWPWARVRSARLAAATISLAGQLDLDAVVQHAAVGSATGDAVSSFLGTNFDFA